MDDTKAAELEARVARLEILAGKIEAGVAYLVKRQAENDKEFLALLRTLKTRYVKPDGSIKIW